MRNFLFSILVLAFYPTIVLASTSPISPVEDWSNTPPAGPFPGLGQALLVCFLPLVVWGVLKLTARRKSKGLPQLSTLKKIVMFFFFWAFSAIALPELILSLGLTFVGYTLYYLSKRYRLIGKLTKASAMGLTILSLVCFCVFDRFQLFPVYYDYSLPQQALLYELGNPDAFEIIFASGDSEQSHREEVWHYYDYEMSYHFKDGEYAYSEELVFPATEWVKTSYEPWGFNRYMGENYLWDDFTFQQSEDEQPGAMPSFKLEEVWPELIEGMNISLQYHDQLALGFDSVTGRLIYVNASAVLEERQ